MFMGNDDCKCGFPKDKCPQCNRKYVQVFNLTRFAFYLLCLSGLIFVLLGILVLVFILTGTICICDGVWYQ